MTTEIIEVIEKGPPGPPGESAIPDGGTTGQVLGKSSGTDGDYDWKDQPVTFRGVWSDRTSQPNDMVIDQGYLAICLAETEDRPAPKDVGIVDLSIDDSVVFSTASDASVISCSQTYTITKLGFFKSLWIYVPELGANYRTRLIIEDTTDPLNPVFNVLENLTLASDQWNLVRLDNIVGYVGTIVTFTLEIYNLQSNATFSGQWLYGGESNSFVPANGEWGRVGKTSGRIRISKFDAQGADRSADLLGLISASSVTFAKNLEETIFQTYRIIDSVINQPNYVELQTEILDSFGSFVVGNVCNGSYEVPVAASTDYAIVNDHWLTNQVDWATISGGLAFDGVDQPNSFYDAFGLRLGYQRAEISEDWQVISSAEVAAKDPDKYTELYIIESDDTYAIPIHNGTAATEAILNLTAPANDYFELLNGVLTLRRTVSNLAYTLEIATTKTGGGVSAMCVWVEISTDSGATWTGVTNSLRKIDVPSDGEGVYMFDLSDDQILPKGLKYRLKMTNIGGGLLSIEPTANLVTSTGTVTSRSIKMALQYRIP